MPLISRIPEIASRGALGTQKAVEFAGQEIEFRAERGAQLRRATGQEMSKLHWRVNRRDPFKGEVVAGTFYTRFSEYGTLHEVARPVLGPAAEEVREHFVEAMAAAWEHA